MRLFYKGFLAFRTAPVLLALCFFVMISSAHAVSGLFTVQDVKVDVTADNAMSARDQAFAQAQVKAFETLRGRMLSEEESAAFENPDPSVISTLIKDFEVTQEKLSSVRYIGTYTFRFKEREVREFFSRRGVRFTDVGSKPLLILPFYQHNGKTVLWSPYNEWMQAWNAYDGYDGLVPLVVPLGDVQDVADMGGDEALTYDERGLTQMLQRYGAGEAVLAIAIPEPSGGLGVHIYRTDRVGPEYVQKITTRGGDDAYKDAVERVASALQRDWKSRTSASASEVNRLQVRINYNSLEEWSAMQRALERVYGITEVKVVSLSPREARVDLIFQGTERRLRLALQQADMTLTAPRISASGLYGQYGGHTDVQPGMPLVYELYLNSQGGGGYRPY